MNTSPKTARLLALAAAFAAVFWAADRAFAAKNFSELSGTEMRKTLEDAYLADDSYGESATVRDGYKPSNTFLNSKNIELKGKDANGNPIFTFKNLDQFGTYSGSIDRTLGRVLGDEHGTTAADSRAPCAYTYNPKTGMISPLKGEDAVAEGYNPNPPNFNAQVLEKDGTTHVAFRGSGGSLDDWVDTNTGQMVGGLPPQFQLADKLVESVQDTGSGPVRLSGHSEGAGEVQYATLGSLHRGNTDIYGSAFNYQQLSGNVRDIFPPDVQEKAKDHLRYVRIGNDPVSGAPLIGVGALGEEYTLDKTEWKGGDGKDDGSLGSATKEFVLWGIKGVTDRGEAHRMGNVLEAIQGEIGEKLKYERMSFSEQQQYHLDRCLNRLSEIEKEMAQYEGRNLTPEEQAAYDDLKKRYEFNLFQKNYLEESIQDAKEEEAEEAAKKKAEEEAQKKAEEEAAKKAAEEAGVDENGNPITGAEPPEDSDKQDWTPFEDDEEPQEGDSPFGDGYNPFEDDGKEPEEGGEEGGEEESFEPEEETDEFEPGQEPETEDEDESYPPEEDEEQEPYEPEEDEEAEPYEPEEDEEQEPSEPEEDEESESYEPEEDEEQEPYEPEENEEPEATEPEENEEPEPSEPEENEEPEPSEPEENEEPEPSEPEENEEPEPAEPEENEEPEPTEPEEEEEPEPAEPEEEEEPEPYEPEEEEEPEPYEPEEELERYEPPSSLRDEPKLDPDNENYEPYDPNPAFKSWLDWNNQVSINKGNESQILNQYITHEREQESKNTIAQQNADDTRNQGGEAAQTTSSLSASSAANAQSENSWTTHLSDAIQESIEAGLTEAGGTFGRTAGEQLASNLFDKNKNKDKNKGGGGGGSGEGGGGGGGGGGHGDGEGGHEGGGGHGGDGGGGHGHDHGEGEGGGEGGDGGCSEGDSGDYDDGTGGDYDDGTGGGYDDGTGGGYDDGTGGDYDDGTGGGYDDGTGGGYDDHDSGGGYDDGGGYDGGGGGGGGGRITFNTPGSYTVRSQLEPVEPEPVAKEEPQEAKSSGCPGPVHHGCGGCVYEGEWDDDKGGRFWICDKCGHKDHWGPWLE